MDDLKSAADPPNLPATCANGATPRCSWWTVIQRTAHVVGIIHELHPRACIGRLQLPKVTEKLKNDDGDNDLKKPDTKGSVKRANPNWSMAILVHPDNRVPNLVIARSAFPEGECFFQVLFLHHKQCHSPTVVRVMISLISTVTENVSVH